MSIDPKSIETRALEVTRPVLEHLGYDLVACEFLSESGRFVLRLSIEKEGGVTVGDCERASRSVEDLLVVEDVVPVRYNLEVSSPGLFRPIQRPEDFPRFLGEQVRIKTRGAIEGRTHFKGVLAAVEGVELEVVVDGTHYRIPLEEIVRARLEPDELPMREKKTH